MKLCKTCNTDKPYDEFYSNKYSKDGYQYHCMGCQSIDAKKRRDKNSGRGAETSKLWKLANPEKSKEVNRNSQLKRRYGITSIQYDVMLKSQNYVCAICERPETMIDKRTGKLRALALDHDPKTSKVRALLCKKCNTSIGGLNHSIYLLEAAILYLKLT